MQTTTQRHTRHSRRLATAIASAALLWVACLATAASVGASDGTLASVGGSSASLLPELPCPGVSVDPAETCPGIPLPGASIDPAPIAAEPSDLSPVDLNPLAPIETAPIDQEPVVTEPIVSEPTVLEPTTPTEPVPADPELAAPSPSAPTVPDESPRVVADEPALDEPATGADVSPDTTAGVAEPEPAVTDGAVEAVEPSQIDDAGTSPTDAQVTEPAQPVVGAEMIAQVLAVTAPNPSGVYDSVVPVAPVAQSAAAPSEPEPNRRAIPRGAEPESWGAPVASIAALIALPLAQVPAQLAVVPAPALLPAAASAAADLGRAGGGWSAAIVFNLWLRRQLRERRMTQRQLAARSGVNHSTISRLLTGDRMPSLVTATKLARALRKIGEDGDVARYFDDLTESTLIPTQRVEAALRGDEELDPQDVREVLNTYLQLRARRRRQKAS